MKPWASKKVLAVLKISIIILQTASSTPAANLIGVNIATIIVLFTFVGSVVSPKLPDIGETKGVLVGPKCNTMDTCIFAKDYVLLSTIVAMYVIEEIEALSAWKVKKKAILSNVKVMRIF